MRILKTTQSGFAGFFKDEYTSLPDAYDRVLSTVAYVKWLYIDTAEDYDETWESVKNVTLEVFSGPAETGEFTESVQRTAYKTAEKILKEFPGIHRAEIAMPNVHYFSANLGKIGIENNNEVFAPADDPHGNIRVALRRT
ncbi:uricase-like [Amphiura filiformis]|uniref:uricase-like n=1 Tax=Amphiura filiformis TaxID=82378 RepID=UPI003B2144DD